MPVEPTVATEAVLLLHVPPEVVLFSVVVAPVQTTGVPVMAATAGNELTVTTANIELVHPKLLVTV